MAYDVKGTPFSPAYGDVYHSAAGALGQARHVFLGGNGLPRSWGGRQQFTVLETGFGLGINFLATWQAWRGDPARGRHLHFVSVEKHPFRKADLATLLTRAVAEDSTIVPLVDVLLRLWPRLRSGEHRLSFPEDGVALTLVFGDVGTLVPGLQIEADALFLDGFAPQRNPAMWSPQVFAALARVTRPGATLATWCTAPQVREDLASAGFAVERVRGYGTKRRMLRGRRLPVMAEMGHGLAERRDGAPDRPGPP